LASCSADGHYEVSFHSNVVVDYKGSMLWVPPAIYKSSCRIDVEFFPFDEQNCLMQFGECDRDGPANHYSTHTGSWTYNKNNENEVTLKWYNGKPIVELNDYSYSGIWDIMDAPGQLKQNNSVVEFSIVIRRYVLPYFHLHILGTIFAEKPSSTR
jgi:nicotinic acetylcholine receptor